MPLMNAKPGEIWLADLGLAAKTRPVLIVSRFDPDAPRALLTYLPLTTQQRGSRYEIKLGDLPFLHQTSVVNVQGIGSLIEPRLERRLGQSVLCHDGEGQRCPSLRARTVGLWSWA